MLKVADLLIFGTQSYLVRISVLAKQSPYSAAICPPFLQHLLISSE
jgi:hypothetical protein